MKKTTTPTSTPSASGHPPKRVAHRVVPKDSKKKFLNTRLPPVELEKNSESGRSAKRLGLDVRMLASGHDASTARKLSQFASAIRQHVQRRLVVLSWLEGNQKERNVKVAPVPHALVGVLYKHGTRHLILTTGHALDDRQRRMEEGFQVLTSRLIAGFADPSETDTSQVAINFSFGQADTGGHYSDEDGIDFGVIALDEQTARQLVSGGAVFVTKAEINTVVANFRPESFDVNVAVGFPLCFRKGKLGPGRIMTESYVPAIVGLRSIDAPEQHAKAMFRLVGELIPTVYLDPVTSKRVRLTDCDGMSGGALCGIRFGPDYFDIEHLGICTQRIERKHGRRRARDIYLVSQPLIAHLPLIPRFIRRWKARERLASKRRVTM